MKNFLIYGSRTPFGKRLHWYLEHYAEHRGMTINVLSLERVHDNMPAIQHDMWGNMVGPTTASRPDIVINCDLLSQRYADTDATLAWERHTQIPTRLAVAARSAGIPYIQLSSDRVFTGRGGPNTMPKPSSVFGITLAHGEAIVRKFHPIQKEELIGAFILRFSTLYGDSIDNWPSQAMSEHRLSVTVPTTRESPTFLGEAAFLVARNLLESPQSLRRDDGILNCGPVDEPISFYDLMNERFTVTEIKEGTREGSYGLVPTKGWATSRGWDKAWGDFERESALNTPLRFW